MTLDGMTVGRNPIIVFVGENQWLGCAHGVNQRIASKSSAGACELYADAIQSASPFLYEPVVATGFSMSPDDDMPLIVPEAATLPPRVPVNDQGTLPPVEANNLTTVAGTRAPPPTADVSVPGYEILGELGRGGMGVVYRARQLGLNRIVALKMILSGAHAGEADVARFRIEAEAIARMRHRNIVQVFEIGDQDGMPFFSLEFCEGGSLASELRGEPQPPKDAAFMVETLARAIDYAHQHQVLHRDLKPANVLLTADGELKITDFGLAKRLDADDGRTGTGVAMGTPAYMAPEQVNGVKDIGPAADTYALGVILYEMLTGRPPFKAATPLDTMLQVVSDEPIAPRKLVRKTPPDLETICLKCLNKKPRERYATAGALADDLAAFQAGDSIKARRVADWERVRRWTRRHPGLALMIASTVLLPSLIFTANALGLGEWDKQLSNMMQSARQALPSAMPDNVSGRASEWSPLESIRHHERLWSVTVHPDGKRVVAGDEDGSIVVWELATGKEAKRIAGHTDAVLGLAFRDDGVLASVGADGAIKIWNVQTGSCEKTLTASGPPVRAVAFDPTGRWLATAGQDKVVRLWDGQSWALRGTLSGHTRAVNSVAFSVDGMSLVTAGNDRRVRRWDVASAKEQLPSLELADRASGAAFAADGRFIHVLEWQRGYRTWKPPASTAMAPVFGARRAQALAVASHGKWFAVAGFDNSVIAFPSADPPVETVRLTGPTDPVAAVAFSPDGMTLFAAGGDRQIHRWKWTAPTTQGQ